MWFEYTSSRTEAEIKLNAKLKCLFMQVLFHFNISPLQGNLSEKEVTA
jgi:hypothetical protein